MSIEESFEITCKLDGERESVITVIPGNGQWLCVLSGKETGTLKNTGEDSWYWVKGKMDRASAQVVGLAIESHYM